MNERISYREWSTARATSAPALNQVRSGPSRKRRRILARFGFGNSGHRARINRWISTLDPDRNISRSGSAASAFAPKSAGNAGLTAAKRAKRHNRRKELCRQLSAIARALDGDLVASRVQTSAITRVMV